MGSTSEVVAFRIVLDHGQFINIYICILWSAVDIPTDILGEKRENEDGVSFMVGAISIAEAWKEESAEVIHVGGKVLCQDCTRGWNEWVAGAKPIKGIVTFSIVLNLQSSGDLDVPNK
ncbi:hypothetical protein RJ639_044673 [Escallonia herrerae]|uniref:Uncharacterized protein n=1 Tax=Escallonia herrerae TaxID=1293975 RepID=A0AA89B974_9ASTE|nr:hypothetical protein RJ639_044673 [Escallonia herrerae]